MESLWSRDLYTICGFVKGIVKLGARVFTAVLTAVLRSCDDDS